ncbi:MAG: hypothetical protein COW65_15335 [Cytophagales bacterium CG18_big_fil_WC_8_21_14_2_50_42_9]|nr:MAG: hypothetical protein COW65_15335 [Cytophagales bacterium CG18_big_fil_WC_8_21_14_2_50_42_9]
MLKVAHYFQKCCAIVLSLQKIDIRVNYFFLHFPVQKQRSWYAINTKYSFVASIIQGKGIQAIYGKKFTPDITPLNVAFIT